MRLETLQNYDIRNLNFINEILTGADNKITDVLEEAVDCASYAGDDSKACCQLAHFNKFSPTFLS